MHERTVAGRLEHLSFSAERSGEIRDRADQPADAPHHQSSLPATIGSVEFDGDHHRLGVLGPGLFGNLRTLLADLGSPILLEPAVLAGFDRPQGLDHLRVGDAETDGFEDHERLGADRASEGVLGIAHRCRKLLPLL